MFEIQFTESAFEDIAYLRKSDQNWILDEIEVHLSSEPLVPTKKRKQLRLNDLSKWELRLGKFRVFYDVDEKSAIVMVKALGWKEHNSLFIRGKEFVL